jgi:hypothetical protein
MTSYDYKTLRIWIGNIREGVTITQKLDHFNSILGFASFKTHFLSSRTQQN